MKTAPPKVKREPLDPAAAEAAAAKAAAKADKAAAKAALAAEKAAAKAAAGGAPKPRKPRKTKAQKELEEQQKKDQEAAAASGGSLPAAGTTNPAGAVPTTSVAGAMPSQQQGTVQIVPRLPNGLPYIKQEPGLMPPSMPGMPMNTTANSFMPPNTTAISSPADIPTMDTLFSAPPSMVKLEDTSELAQYGIHPGHFPPPGMPHPTQFGMPPFPPRGMHPAFTTAGGSMGPGMHPAFAMSGMGMPPPGMHPVTASGFLPPPAAHISSTAHPATLGNPVPIPGHNTHGHVHSHPPQAHTKSIQDKSIQPQSGPGPKQQKSATNKDPVMSTSEIPASSTTAATAAWINQHFNQPIPSAAHISGQAPTK